MASDVPHADPELPDIDDRLVEPGTPYEMYDGELVHVLPADPPHGECHVQLAALIEAHTGPAFEVAADLLTRTSKVDDVAPDISVYPDAPDPVTGRRQLEQLAFEIVSTQSLARAGIKAAKLARRGVRRVFAIDIERSRVLEWSRRRRTWSPLASAGSIEDPALEVPLRIEDVLRDAKADDAVARALLAKHNPVLAKNRAEGVAEGHTKGLAKGKALGRVKGKALGRAKGLAEGKALGRAEGKARAVIAMLTARGITVAEDVRARILGERDERRLDRWVVRALTCATAGELLAGRGDAGALRRSRTGRRRAR